MVAPEDMIALDRWMVDRALQLQNELHEDYGNYASCGFTRGVQLL